MVGEGLEVKDLLVIVGGFSVRVGHLGVGRGEIAVIQGPNGAGKTTLLKAIAGIIRPVRGTIVIGGEVVFKADERVEVNKPPEKRRVGFLPQNLLLFPHMSVYENIAYAMRGRKIRPTKEKVSEILELVGLRGFENRKPWELSYGQQQRVALARALASNPRVLLLDEPFANIDVESRRELRKEIARLVKALGVPTVVVSHDLEDLAVADKPYSMNRGVLSEKN
ncbi:ABC transporter related protein [Thermogladius calderae 1633]|uniref:Molybdate/tungstate import ATP-binding protein WtpC n=1 Tax=Thermogladius calderae (strain DSM 22663 / VKM B-2946 / 1633) TaxID=1184251 RepID=I3TCS8_THEC1|nr:ABC transporter related protein [Thermogladius calderae 1633]